MGDNDSETHRCSACGREFDDRDEFVAGLLLDGQSVSKGQRSPQTDECCHPPKDADREE